MRFFYSLGAWERVKHRLKTLAFFAPLAPFALPFKADGLSRTTEIILESTIEIKPLIKVVLSLTHHKAIATDLAWHS